MAKSKVSDSSVIIQNNTENAETENITKDDSQDDIVIPD